MPILPPRLLPNLVLAATRIAPGQEVVEWDVYKPIKIRTVFDVVATIPMLRQTPGRPDQRSIGTLIRLGTDGALKMDQFDNRNLNVLQGRYNPTGTNLYFCQIGAFSSLLSY